MAKKVNKKEEEALESKGFKEGDYVWTNYRNGVREGKVTKLARTTDEHPHPPKVLFVDKKTGKEVAHNPSTLSKKEAGEGDNEEEEEEENE